MDAIDFTNLSGLGDVSASEAADVAYNAMMSAASGDSKLQGAVGMFKGQLAPQIDSYLSKHNLVIVQSSSPPSNAISASALLDNLPNVLSGNVAKGLLWSAGVSANQVVGAANSAAQSLQSQGYYLVPAGGGSSSGPSFTQSATNFVQSASNWNPFSGALTFKAPDYDSIYAQRDAAARSAMWRARLPWIIGIGGLLFIASIALLASD